MSKRVDALNVNQQDQLMQDTVFESLYNEFPIQGVKHNIRIKNIIIDETKAPINDLPAQKELKLDGKSWVMPVYADFDLIDNETGKVISNAKKMKITSIPRMTNRYSVIIDGNEYQTLNQFRLRSGVYTREKSNGQFESQFNLEKGFNFKMMLDPKKEVFFLQAGNQNYPIYAILHALGMPDEPMRKEWGNEIFEANARAGIRELHGSIIKLVNTLLHHKTDDYAEALKLFREYLEDTSVSPETTELTLGQGFNKVNKNLILATSVKLLKVMRREEKEDERDSLIFKELFTPQDQLKAFLEARTAKITRKIKWRLDNKDTIRDIVPTNIYGDPIKEFFSVGELSSPPPQTNPTAIVGEYRKTTVMGTGGIQSRHAVTMNVRDVHPSTVGFLDPINTPESGKIGVTLPLSVGVAKTEKGLVTKIITANGKIKELTPKEMWDRKIGFPDQYKMVDGAVKPVGALVKGNYKGDSLLINSNEIYGYLHNPTFMFSYQTNLIPFLSTVSGNRAMVASKQLGQAVAVSNPDKPRVRVLGPNKKITFGKVISNVMNPYIPAELRIGTVSKITKDYVYIKDENNKTHRIGLFNDFPLNQEAFLNSKPIVAVGDKVKANDMVAENNFQNQGELALGINARIAYMPWKGYNFEDSVVVTESFANRMTSEKILKFAYTAPREGIIDKAKLLAYYPDAITPDNYAKLDEEGIIKPELEVDPGDTLIAGLSPKEYTDEEKILKSMNKNLAIPYAKSTLTYDGQHRGKVLYVRKLTRRRYTVYVKVIAPMEIGDKIAGRYGNKMIVSKIIPDDIAPHTKDDKAIDVIASPFGVPARMNIGQLLETAAGKLSEKTGKDYEISNFDGTDHLAKLKKEFKANGLDFDEVLTDGKGGKTFKNKVFTGNQHILKLLHVVEHKLKHRSYGAYGMDEQPVHGSQGGQAFDQLTSYVAMAHGAKANLYDATAIKGQKNDEIWRNIQLGLPIPPPNRNFAWDKMVSYLKASGVNVEKQGDYIQASPLTDKDVVALAGANSEIKDAGHMLIGKNLATIKGGLFDQSITGGMQGKKWGYIKLEEKIPSPLMQKSITSILGLTNSLYTKILNEQEELGGKTGFKAIESALGTIDVKVELKKARKALQTVSPPNIDKLNKKIRYLEALEKFEISPKELMISKVPIMPPVFRPVYPLPTGDIMVNPINWSYRQLGLVNNSLKQYKSMGADAYKTLGTNARKSLYESVSEVQGVTDPIGFGQEKRLGALAQLSGKKGTSPKYGFIQSKLWRKRQDVTGRSTITLEPSLGLDQIGIPEVMGWDIYRPFIMQELRKQGFQPIQALEEIDKRTDRAREALVSVMKQRPVLVNRAPSLHKFGLQAFNPINVDGNAIKLNPLVTKGFNADFDGDTMSVHVPITDKAVEEAYGMMPSRNVFMPGAHGAKTMPIQGFGQDYQLGIWLLTRAEKKSVKEYESIAAAYKAKVPLTTEITIKGTGKTTLGREVLVKTVPKKFHKFIRANEMTGKNVNELMTRIALESYPDYGQVADSLKSLGADMAHQQGFSMSLNDLDIDRSYRDKTVADTWRRLGSNASDDKVVSAFMGIDTKIAVGQAKAIKDKEKEQHRENNMRIMIDSGAGGGKLKSNAGQVWSMPGILLDVHNNPISVPNVKSWTEGQDVAGYWNSMYGARKGAVDRAVNTQDTGFLNKSLLAVTRNLIITEEDCDTDDGIDIAIIDKNAADRYLAENIPGVAKKDDLVTQELLRAAKLKKLKTVKVRSPLTCETAKGVCIQCYGLMSSGKPPKIGDNVGIIDGQTMTERSTQLQMQTFHSGGTAKGSSMLVAGFPRIVQLLKVPAVLGGKATLAEVSGKVENIKENPLGGYDIIIAGILHRVLAGMDLKVKEGSIVLRGDALSEGITKPQELGKLKTHLDAEKYIVDELDGVFDGQFHKRTYETVVRAMGSQARITEAPEDSELIRGDVADVWHLKKVNKKRKTEGKTPLQYESYFKSIDMLPHDRADWLSRLSVNRLRNTVQEAAARGLVSDIHGVDPVPAYLYGVEFGKKKDSTY